MTRILIAATPDLASAISANIADGLPGAVVVRARGAAEAVGMLARDSDHGRPFGALVLECTLSGAAAVADGLHLPIIFVTLTKEWRAQLGERIAASHLRAAGFIVWPAEAEELPPMLAAVTGETCC